MATTAEVASLVTRNSSFDLLPPYMSELRVALLGNCWTQRCSVGNYLVDQDVFDACSEPQCSSRSLRDKKMTVINTPDLLEPDITQRHLVELIQEFANMSKPGLHIFLLVLQPENFTEQQQLRLQSVLEKFREQPFDQAIVLIATDREEGAEGISYIENRYLEKMIRKCGYRHMCWKNFDHNEKRLKNFKVAELHARLGQIFKENNGDYLKYEADAWMDIRIVDQVQEVGLTAADFAKRQDSKTCFQPRILLFGKSEDTKELFRKCITRLKLGQSSSSEMEQKERLQIVVKTPDLFRTPMEDVRAEISRCVLECFPGPNALVLLVRPSDFTENDRETLRFILMLFGPNALKHSFVIVTHDEQRTVSVKRLLQDCEYRLYEMFEDNLSLLMDRIEAMVQSNKGSFVTDCLSEIPQRKGENEVGVIIKPSASFPAQCKTCFQSVSTPLHIKHQREMYERLASKIQRSSLFGNNSERVEEEEKKEVEKPERTFLERGGLALRDLFQVRQGLLPLRTPVGHKNSWVNF